MHHSLLGVLRVVVSICLVLLVTGCGEDPRYSARTQYLGGAYGSGEGGPPRDTVSYWDGDSSNGSPSVKISLGEQRAYFYKGGVLVGVSQLSTGREGLNTPLGTLQDHSKGQGPCLQLVRGLCGFGRECGEAKRRYPKRPEAAGQSFQGHANAVFHAHCVGNGYACRLFTRLSGVARLYPHA